MCSSGGITDWLPAMIYHRGNMCAKHRQRWAVSAFAMAFLAWGCDSPHNVGTSAEEGLATKASPDGIGTATSHSPQARLPLADALRPEDWFVDRTATSQVEFRYETGREAECFTILETVGGGVGIVDFDLDTRPDLFCVGGGAINRESSVPTGRSCGLFRNMDGVQFRDVTVSSRLNLATDYSHGCVSGDVNSDGFPDVFVTCYGQNCLLVNQGDGTFSDETEAAGLKGQPTWNTAAAFGDVNRDGELDLFVAGYVDWVPSSGRPSDVPPPQDYHPVPDHLFLNSGNGRFVEISDAAGIRKDGMGLGVIAADVNDDQRIDFYVANDVVENHLYLGTDALPFKEVASLSGVACSETGRPEGSMGVDCADVNGDSRADLWVTNFEMEDNSLYLNEGEGQFRHSTVGLQLAGVGRPQVKFGTGLRDFDGDGWLDLFFVCGHVRYRRGLQPFLQPSVLCRNRQGAGFVDITPQGGMWFRTQHAARGTATGDLNGDGGLDLVVSSLTESLALLYNQRPAENWLRIRLVGTRSSRTPIGCRLSLSAFGRECVRNVTSGSGYLSHSEDCLFLAVEPNRLKVDATVMWPSGRLEVYSELPTLSESVLVEGQGQVSAQSPTANQER